MPTPHPEWDRIRPVLDAALGDHAVEGSAGTLEFPVNERAGLDAVRGRHKGPRGKLRRGDHKHEQQEQLGAEALGAGDHL